ncbi:hypothetical protein BIFDEN_01425 [Bifidobacterium dentium ATCC 27678]|nr:hypothetical protein BIFDEN_01425 [Bifidobacterium dentium ATCC 27678]
MGRLRHGGASAGEAWPQDHMADIVMFASPLFLPVRFPPHPPDK